MEERKKIIWELFDVKNVFNLQDDEDDDLEEDEANIGILNKLRSTPMGIIPEIKQTIFKTYQMWAANTNFRLTAREHSIMADTLGVESIVVVSPYRFVVGIGKCFNSQKVRLEVERKLTRVVSKKITEIKNAIFALNEKLPDEYISLLKEFAAKDEEYSYVGMYIIPNGEVDWYYTNNVEEFESKMDEYYNIFSSVGGYIKMN